MLAAAVGGLVTAVRDGVSGVLVDGHDPVDWARCWPVLPATGAPAGSAGAPSGTPDFSWQRTASGLLAVYGEAITEHRGPAGAACRDAGPDCAPGDPPAAAAAPVRRS